MTDAEKRVGDLRQARWRQEIPPESIWRHRKSSCLYTVTDIGLAQTKEFPQLDGQAVVLYRSLSNPGPFVRRCEEFLGAFDRLDPAELAT